METFIQSESND